MRRLIIIALFGAACGFDFADPGIVVNRRVLALEVDPPQLTASTKHVSANALVVDRFDLGERVAFGWSVCAVAPTLGGGGLVGANVTRCDDAGLVLASGEAALDELQLDVPVPREVPAAARLQVELVVGGDAGLYAVKQISPPVSSMLDDAPNTNPIISGVLLDGLAWNEDGGFALTLGECVNGESQTVSAGRGMTSKLCSHRVDALIADDQHQTYTTTDALGNQMKQKERMRFSYFTNDGVMERDTTSEPNPSGVMPVSGDGGVSSRWDEPSKLTSFVSTVWIVVRDGRGGESFVTRHVFWNH